MTLLVPAVLFSTNVKKTRLTHLYCFRKLTIADKVCSFIYRFDTTLTFTNDPNSTASNEVERLFFVNV